VALKALLISDNLFGGSLDNVFMQDNVFVQDNVSMHYIGNLQTVDISRNGFTGNLPNSLFNSSSLLNVFAGQNCFSGPISSTICNAVALVSLELTQMAAGHFCTVKYPFPFDFFYLAVTGMLNGVSHSVLLPPQDVSRLEYVSLLLSCSAR